MSTIRTRLGGTLVVLAAMFTAAASLAVPASAASSGADAATGPREAIVTRDSAGKTTVMAPDAKGNWATVNSASSVGLLLDGGTTNACALPNGTGGANLNCNEPVIPTPPPPAPEPPVCEPPFCGPPPPPCFDFFHAYIIYFPFGPELMRWSFKETYCYDGLIVSRVTSTNEIRVFSSAIVKGGSNTNSIGPFPASVVRVVYPNQTFAYCPLTLPSNCVANFSPVIDHYFLGSGQILNLSTL